VASWFISRYFAGKDPKLSFVEGTAKNKPIDIGFYLLGDLKTGIIFTPTTPL
jgi:hypothetical protein